MSQMKLETIEEKIKGLDKIQQNNNLYDFWTWMTRLTETWEVDDCENSRRGLIVIRSRITGNRYSVQDRCNREQLESFLQQAIDGIYRGTQGKAAIRQWGAGLEIYYILGRKEQIDFKDYPFKTAARLATLYLIFEQKKKA